MEVAGCELRAVGGGNLKKKKALSAWQHAIFGAGALTLIQYTLKKYIHLDDLVVAQSVHTHYFCFNLLITHILLFLKDGRLQGLNRFA